MEPLKVYTASRFTAKSRVRGLNSQLRRAGFVVSHDWTAEEPPPPCEDAKTRLAFLRQAAALDRHGVRDADYFIMYAQPRATGAQGCWVELGIALEAGKKIIIVGHEDLCAGDAEPCIFLHLLEVQRVTDEAGLLAYLEADRRERCLADVLARARGKRTAHAPVSDEFFYDGEDIEEAP